MRIRTASVLLGGLVLTLACRANRESAPAEATPAVTAAPEPVAVAAPVASVVVRDVGFQTPECVLHDDESDVYFVSNINGPETAADGNGFISRLDPQGKVLDLKWIDGSKPGQTLDAPKGMALSGQLLYVADIASVRMFDRKTGKGMGKVAIPGATFLNDLSAAPDGSVWASDSGLSPGKTDLEPNGTDAIYRIADGKAEPIAKDRSLGLPNGLLADADGTWVVTFGSGELYRITRGGKRENIQRLESGQLDGVARASDGSLLVSSWERNAILRGHPGGVFTAAIDGVVSPADFAYDAKGNRVWIPLFTKDTVEIRVLPPAP